MQQSAEWVEVRVAEEEIQNLGPVMVGTGSGALHKEGTGLSTHLLELPGVSKMRSLLSTNTTFPSMC